MKQDQKPWLGTAKKRKGRTLAANYEEFTLREASRVLRFPLRLLRLYLGPLHERFGIYRDIQKEGRQARKQSSKTSYNPRLTEERTKEWNDTKRFEVANQYLSNRSCYRILQTDIREQAPGRTTRTPGTVVAHLVRIIYDAEQFGETTDPNDYSRYLFIIAERHTGFLKAKLFKQFNEKTLVTNIKQFKHKLELLGMPIQQIRFVAVEEPGEIITTACRKTEIEIKSILQEAALFDGQDIIVEPPLGYSIEVIIEFPSKYQLNEFKRLKSKYDRLIRSQIISPIETGTHSIKSFLTIVKNIDGAPNFANVHWSKLRLRIINTKARFPKYYLRIFDFIETGNIPLIIPKEKHKYFNKKWLSSNLNKYNIGSKENPSRPLVSMWEYTSTVDRDKVSLTLSMLRKLMKF